MGFSKSGAAKVTVHKYECGLVCAVYNCYLKLQL